MAGFFDSYTVIGIRRHGLEIERKGKRLLAVLGGKIKIKIFAMIIHAPVTI